MQQYQEIGGETKNEENRTGQGGIKRKTGTGGRVP
jgi:hypothetical protein